MPATSAGVAIGSLFVKEISEMSLTQDVVGVRVAGACRTIAKRAARARNEFLLVAGEDVNGVAKID